MLYDFLIVGSGLSAACFLHGLRQKNKNIIASYQSKKLKSIKKFR